MRNRQARQSSLRPDWLRLAELWDHRLTPEDPVWISSPGPDASLEPLAVHVHKGLDVGIQLVGSMELHYGDYALTTKPGEVWLGAMWEPHAWRRLTEGTHGAQVSFLPEFLEEQLDPELDLLRIFTVPASQRPRVTSEQMRMKAMVLGHRLNEEGESRRPGWLTMVRTLVLQLLVMLAREWKPPRAAAPGAIRANDLARVVPAIALVNSSPAVRISTEAGAKACGLGRSSFCEAFQRAMGMSYGAFGMRSRLTLVAHALLDTDVPVEAIASEAGFADASHLHRRFVAHYGCTPADYRRRNAPQRLDNGKSKLRLPG